MIILAFALLAVASFIIPKFSDLIVSALVRMTKEFNVSDFSMGFFVLGLATSTPELFVGMNAVLKDQPQLSLGNLIGASIILLSFIVGISAIVSEKIVFVRSFNHRDMWLTSFVIFCPTFLLIDGKLSRFDGIFLTAFYIMFVLAMNRKQTFWEQVRITLGEEHNHLTIAFLKLLGGVVGLILTSKVIVESALFIASSWKLPVVLVGLLIVAIGTNLPEMTIMISSIRKAHSQISIGDFIGSAAANTFVLGLIAIMHPITIQMPIKVLFSVGMLLLTLLFFNAFFAPDKTISRQEGIALVALYSFFLFSEIFIRNGI